MGRRSEKLMTQEGTAAAIESAQVIQVISRAFDILRCFERPSMRLGNREFADRCGLPRSTVSRLTFTFTADRSIDLPAARAEICIGFVSDRDKLRRFLTQGRGYQPTTVRMFH
ncbi:helix-turn-helix domain-containing protein [Bradyrhizobium vignae]|uniref:helix-turn-helix domain-containing protein n=1 Tax=Bradyrhizobium vignae TaxID=1549949 RepID=UPI003D322D57